MNWENLDLTNIFFAIHVIGFVSWIAGLLYLGRVLVYHGLAYEKNQNEKKILIKQFLIMEKRVNFFIAFPAMLLTLVMGFLLMFKTRSYYFTWFQIKFFLILIMIALHFYYGLMVVKFKKNQELDRSPYSIFHLKLINELITLIFIFIVLSASLKIVNLVFFAWGITLVFFILTFILIRFKKKSRS